MHLYTGYMLMVVGLATCAGVSASAASAVDAGGPLTVPRLSEPPVIDGRGDDDAWSDAAILSSFVQTYPSPGSPPRLPTEVGVGFAARAIYFLVRAVDDPSRVRAAMHARDDLGDDDLVAIYIDTFGDGSRAYVLRLNPLGVQQDGIFVEGGGTDLSADLAFRSAGRLTPDGWELEVEVPFASLRFPRRNEQTWCLQVLRQARQVGEESSWRSLPVEHAVRFPLERQFLLSGCGALQIMDPLTGERWLEATPCLVADWGGERVPVSADSEGEPADSAWTTRSLGARGGLTASGGLGRNFTLGMAYRPDFGEVEADPPVLTANNPFPLYFVERRPFFLEGLDLLRMQARSVDTRRIETPQWALKGLWEGRRDALVLLTARDTGSRPSTEVAEIGLVRYRRSLGEESWIGTLLAERRDASRDNAVTSVDGRFRLGTSTTLAALLSASSTDGVFYDPVADLHARRRGTGAGYAFDLDHQTRRTSWRLSGLGFTPDYRADLGFVARTDSHRLSVDTRYSPPARTDGRLVSWAFLHTALLQTDSNGLGQYAYLYPRLELVFQRETYANFALYADYLHLVEEDYGPRRAPGRSGAFSGAASRSTIYHGGTATLGTRLGSAWGVEVTVDRSWNSFDYDLGAGPKFPRVSPAALADPDAPLDPGSADGSTDSLTLSWQPNETWRVDLSLARHRLVRDDTGLVAYDSKIGSLRLEQHFSRSAFARLRLDHDSLTAQSEAQLLFAFRPSLGTSLSIGYEDARSYDGFDPWSGVREEGWRRSRQTAFVKLSYTMRQSWQRGVE